MAIIDGVAEIAPSDRERRIERMHRIIDQRIREALDDAGDGFFKKAEVVSQVVNGFGELPERKNLDMRVVMKAYVDGRLTGKFLHSKDEHGLRIYENYADGTGERRWQKLRLLTASQLRVIVFDREIQVARHEAVLKVYRETLAALEDMEKHGESLHVGDVIDYVAEEHDLSEDGRATG